MTVQHTHWFDVTVPDCPACPEEIDAPELRHECEICGWPSSGVWCRRCEINDNDRAEISLGARGAA